MDVLSARADPGIRHGKQYYLENKDETLIRQSKPAFGLSFFVRSTLTRCQRFLSSGRLPPHRPFRPSSRPDVADGLSLLNGRHESGALHEALSNKEHVQRGTRKNMQKI